MNKSFSKKRAFSLIELLVVIAIIAILSAIVLGSMYLSKQKSRDAKRASDIAQIQLALEQFFDKCRRYPTALNTTATTHASWPCAGVTLGSFISTIPKDPSTGAVYTYSIENTNYLDYILKADMETPTEVINDALDSTFSNLSGYAPAVTCSNVPANKAYCIGPK